MIFNKYEFESEAKWLEVKKTLYITEIIDDEEVTYLRPEINSIVEIGFICFAGWVCLVWFGFISIVFVLFVRLISFHPCCPACQPPTYSKSLRR